MLADESGDVGQHMNDVQLPKVRLPVDSLQLRSLLVQEVPPAHPGGISTELTREISRGCRFGSLLSQLLGEELEKGDDWSDRFHTERIRKTDQFGRRQRTHQKPMQLIRTQSMVRIARCSQASGASSQRRLSLLRVPIGEEKP